MWRELVLFFPSAVPFRAESSECLECLGESASGKRAEEAVKREREQEIALPVLKALFGRKNGVSITVQFKSTRHLDDDRRRYCTCWGSHKCTHW